MAEKKRNHRSHTVGPGGPARETGRPVDSNRSVWLAMASVSLYVLWVIVVPPRWIDPDLRQIWRWPQLVVHDFVGAIYDAVGVDTPSPQLQAGGFYVVTAFLVPWLLVSLMGRGRLTDLGWRRPNRLLLRIVMCSFVVSVPFLYWMVHSPGFLAFYKPYIEAGPVRLILYYLVVLFCEHSFMEGTMLGVFRAGHRWPAPAVIIQDATSGPRRVLQWFGLAQPTGGARGAQRITRWVGLPDGCFAAIALSGALFGLVHWGKDGREFLLSFPGGIFLAFLAYRCNSWHAPYLLHASTVLAAGLMLMALQG